MEVDVALQAVAVLVAFVVAAWKAITVEIAAKTAGVYVVLTGLAAAFLIQFAQRISVQ